MRKITLLDRLRYRFDNLMARGTIALIGWLFVASLLLVALASIILVVFGEHPADRIRPSSFAEIAWMSLLRTLDPGTMGDDQGSPLFLSVMLLVTIGGIFLVSTLISVINTGLNQRLAELRKGRSFVVENGHIVILGWSSQIFTVIEELALANEHDKNTCVVVLADKDKIEMEDEIRTEIGRPPRTRIVCRTGSPISMQDLEIVNLHAARVIIILAPEDIDADSHVIKTILAITNNRNRHVEPYHIVAELRDPRNFRVAQMVGRGETQFIQITDLISRIIVQTSRSNGLSVVYLELLNYTGSEIYFWPDQALLGRTFGESLIAFEDSVLIGVFTADGKVMLRPPMERRFKPGDQPIMIAENIRTIRLTGRTPPAIPDGYLLNPPPRQHNPERTLILGWNVHGPLVIHRLEGYVAPGSHVDVIASNPAAAHDIDRYCAVLKNQSVSFREDDSTDRDVLDSLDLCSYQHVVVLSYSNLLDIQAADARTLITLLHLRDIADKLDHPFSIVSEILDIRNRELARVTRVDDFIISDRLVSLMLAQIAQNRYLAEVFGELFDPTGSEIQMRPAHEYVRIDVPLTFYTLTVAASRCGEVAIGYWIREDSERDEKHHGVHINPPKSRPITLSDTDQIIILTSDQWVDPGEPDNSR
jgi:voltage-gated potassium channel Kch